MKTWRVQYDFESVFFPIANLTRCKTFNSKSDAFWKVSFQNHAFKKAPKGQNISLSRSKMNENVIFWMQKFFRKLTCPKFNNSKSNALYFFQSKIWRFVRLFHQNLTCFEIFISKADALEKLNSKSEKFQTSFLRNVSSILFFKFWLNEDIFSQS